MVMAFFNIVLPFSLITWGERFIPSNLAAILQATTPLFTIVIASLALAEEAITLNRLVGLIIGFGGVVILLGRGLGGGGGDQLIGEVAIALSSLSYAIGNVFVRLKMRGQHPTVPAFFQVGIALVAVTVLALVFESPIKLPSTPSALFAVVWLGVFGSAFAYLIYFRLVHVLGPTRLSLITYLMPIVAIVLGFLVLGEVIDLQTFVGTAVILTGVGLVNSRFGRRKLFGRSPAPAPVDPPAAESAPRPACGRGGAGDADDPPSALGREEERADHDDGRGGEPAEGGPTRGGLTEPERAPAGHQDDGQFADRRDRRQRGEDVGDQDEQVGDHGHDPAHRGSSPAGRAGRSRVGSAGHGAAVANVVGSSVSVSVTAATDARASSAGARRRRSTRAIPLSRNAAVNVQISVA